MGLTTPGAESLPVCDWTSAGVPGEAAGHYDDHGLDGCDQELDVVVVDAGDGVREVDGYAVCQACGYPQHSLFAARAGQAGAQCGDHDRPVNGGRWLSAVRVGVDAGELAGEVGPLKPALGGEELGSGFRAVKALSLDPPADMACFC
jgi:hypothetical protein